MSTIDIIDKAIAAHGSWKQKLRTAIDTGESESKPEKVKQDSNCSFGKWLHERIDPALKNSSHFNKIVGLHAEFHQEAGEILDIALKGDKDRASNRIKLGSNFSKISANLTKGMEDWKSDL